MRQYQRLQEDEMRCQLQQQTQEKRRLLEQAYCPEDEESPETESPQRRYPEEHMRYEVVRPMERTIHIQDDPNEDSEGEYRRRKEHHMTSRRREDPRSPLVVEFEEVPWLSLSQWNIIYLKSTSAHVSNIYIILWLMIVFTSTSFTSDYLSLICSYSRLIWRL
jgi:hypothetical protein